MKYCQYHPLAPATWHCKTCQAFECDLCVDLEPQANVARCFICENNLENLGARFNAEPFWRRMQESFRYPLQSNALIVSIAVAILMSVVSYLPLAVIGYLLVGGTFMKYCFTCLEETAGGVLSPPSITSAYEGGLSLAVQLIVMLFLLIGFFVASYHYFGVAIGSMVGLFMVISLPAILINFALSERVLSALNPLNALALISSIGLPYGLLLALIIVMFGSVGVIGELSTHSAIPFSLVIESVIGNYYTIVVFHIMGYMIFQYQGRLGFVARKDFGEIVEPLPENKRLHAKAMVLVKHGDYDAAIDIYRQVVTQFPHDKDGYMRCFELLLATENKKRINSFLPHFIGFLVGHHREGELALLYKRLVVLWPDYIPDDPGARYAIAKVCFDRNDLRAVIKLINGMHKLYPDYKGLIDAYILLHDVLKTMPKMQTQAAKCTQLIAQLKERQRADRRFVLRSEKQSKPVSVSHNRHSGNDCTPDDSMGKSGALGRGDGAHNNSDLPPIEFK